MALGFLGDSPFGLRHQPLSKIHAGKKRPIGEQNEQENQWCGIPPCEGLQLRFLLRYPVLSAAR